MYFIIAFFVGVLASAAAFRNQVISLCVIAGLTFAFSAIRFNAGFDYLTYYEIIREGPLSRYEPIPRLLMQVSRETSPQLFFIASAAIIVFFNLAAILSINKRLPVTSLALVAFIALPVGLIDSFNTVRQFCAASIFLYAFVNRDRFAIALPLAVLAYMFHKSSLIFAPLLFCGRFIGYALPAYAYIIALLGSIAFGSVIELIAQKTHFYAHYFDVHTTSYGRKALVLFIGLFFAFIFRPQRLSPVRAELNLFFIGLCVWLALAQYGTHISRVSWYGIGAYPLLIGVAIASARPVAQIASATALCTVFATQMIFAAAHPTWDWLNNYRPYFLLSEKEKVAVLNQFSKMDRK